VTTPAGTYLPTWDSLATYQVPDWFRDAKFGIFIHWGPYSVPAFGNEWYSRNMYQPGKPEFEHHRQTYGPQTEFGYKDFIPLLTGEHFDPDAWAALFREAGAQYVVPVAEHHDGFAMYRSELNPWNATAMGPKRDVIGELSQAVRDRSMVFGLSSHRAENWWFYNGGMTFASDVRAAKHTSLYGPAQPQHMPPSTQFLEEWVEHTMELLDAYEPQLLYFDWWIHRPAYKPYLPHLAAHYYNLMAPTGRDPVLTYKDQAFPPGTAVEDVERGSSATLRPEPWQACTSISRKSWCYLAEDQDYKTAQELTGVLADVVSKNGSLLLNVGPKADGTIPDQEQELLKQIGAWLATNGEAIYASRPWTVFGEGPTKMDSGGFSEFKQQPYGPRDFRFTTREGLLYVIGLAAPVNGRIEIRSLGADLTIYHQRIGRIELLGHTQEYEPTLLEFEQRTDALSVRLPQSWETGHQKEIPLPVLRITPAP
jgi:alpha-L-fucosidase